MKTYKVLFSALVVVMMLALTNEVQANDDTNAFVTNSNSAVYDTATVITAITYNVKSGDNLWNIARKYNTSVDELMSLNLRNVKKRNLIYVNQIITVGYDTTVSYTEVKKSNPTPLYSYNVSISQLIEKWTGTDNQNNFNSELSSKEVSYDTVGVENEPNNLEISYLQTTSISQLIEDLLEAKKSLILSYIEIAEEKARIKDSIALVEWNKWYNSDKHITRIINNAEKLGLKYNKPGEDLHSIWEVAIQFIPITKYSQDYRHTVNNGMIRLDCSAFIDEVLTLYGVQSPGRSTHNMKSSRSFAGLDNMNPGDLVLLRNHHVYLCLGDGKYIHCSSKRNRVEIVQIDRIKRDANRRGPAVICDINDMGSVIS